MADDQGPLAPEKKESALKDPVYIRHKLDEIDTNHNGWLEAPELAWFDANQNQILDPAEQTAIAIAQRLLAEKLIKKYDPEGAGGLGLVRGRDIAGC